jgi:hypothetical protein
MDNNLFHRYIERKPKQYFKWVVNVLVMIEVLHNKGMVGLLFWRLNVDDCLSRSLDPTCYVEFLSVPEGYQLYMCSIKSNRLNIIASIVCNVCKNQAMTTIDFTT